MFALDLLAGFEVAHLLRGGLVLCDFKLFDGGHHFGAHDAMVKAKPDHMGDAFGAADRFNALLGRAGLKKDIPRKHGFKNGQRSCFDVLELFVARQLDIKVLSL